MSCGCEFNIATEELNGRSVKDFTDIGLVPPLDIDVEKLPTDCKIVWEMLAKGLTKGIFQLESELGRQWTKRLKPTSLEHLSSLGALLRPGCLHSISEQHGCSLTELYCRRKNGEAPVEYFHPSLTKSLNESYAILVYQEQAMSIAQEIAGFTLQDADVLRKSIGKKIASEMAKVKVMFLEGAKKAKIVTDEEAIEIFNWIEKSQRYSFNKSHAMSYAINGYWSAYLKSHFPVQFFTGFLRGAQDKADPLEEIRELINEAKLFGIEVYTPDITKMREHFWTDGKTVNFGFDSIKGLGDAQMTKLKDSIKFAEVHYQKPISELKWNEFIFIVSDRLTSTTVNNLISCGALDNVN